MASQQQDFPSARPLRVPVVERSPVWKRRFPRWGYVETIVVFGVLLYFAVLILPLFLSVYYSLTNLNILQATNQFVGGLNYARLTDDDSFVSALWFTLRASLLITLGANVVGLGIGLLLNRTGALFAFFRTIFFIPQVLSGVVISFIWAILLSSNQGVINALLQQVGLLKTGVNIAWLGNTNLAFVSIVVVSIWQALGFCVVIYLAALQGIPPDLKDAARIDGANGLQEFRHVVFPLLAPGITVNFVLLLILTFKLYDLVVILTSGGPGGTTESLAFYIVQTAFTKNKTGYASAMAVVMFLIIGGLSVLLVAFLRRREVEY
jgi:multiple sugar transport system permease protein